MFRFTVPDGKTGVEQQKKEIQAQLEEFIRHEALGEIFSILGTDRERILSEYDFRKHSDGKVLELQELERSEENVAELQKRANANIPAEMKKQLYERFWELGMMDINRPLRKDYDRIVVLGGSYEAVWDRTAAAAKWRTDRVRFIDGLSCYRPINPTERGTSKKQYSSAETEFGVMSDAVETVFSPGCGFADAFCGDRNINSISCIRTFETGDADSRFRVYAAPSAEPALRRADTGDSIAYYLNCEGVTEAESILFITNNRHCNRQYLQILCEMLKRGGIIPFDIIGCSELEELKTYETYNLKYYIQEIIAMLNWKRSLETVLESVGG